MKRWVIAIAILVMGASQAHAQLTTNALIDSLQYRSFLFFWNEANPVNGLIRDRSQPGSPCSIASQGFGFSAICTAVDRGWITRQAGRDRILAALQTYWNGPQGTAATGMMGYKGFFYHFLNMSTGYREWSSELSTIDTALLLAGIIDAKMYFDGSDPNELQIRALADSIYDRVDWTFLQASVTKRIKMGWNPEGTGFGEWVGYNEAMIMYILALGSPTHATDPAGWINWTAGYQWSTQFGQTYVIFPPLFGHQYSHCWIDFRYQWDTYMKNKGITYFENSRRATYAQRAYAIANPAHRVAYGDSMWGLTAGDGPTGYNARGAPPSQNDDGTITPTAPVSSIAFAPEICIPVIRNLYNTYGISIWGDYAFTDGFNPTAMWWDLDVIGIDQGPMVLMIENWRTEAIWHRMMRNPDIQRGMQRAGFTAVSLAVEPPAPTGVKMLWNDPNPFRAGTTLCYRLPESGHVRLAIYDITGRRLATLADGYQSAGLHEAPWSMPNLPTGVFLARLEWNGTQQLQRLVRVE